MDKYRPKLIDVDKQLDLMITQFRNKPKLRGLLKALLSPFNDLQQAYIDIYEKRWLNLAEGIQLDLIGDFLGITRDGRTDARYREALYIQIYINISNGEPNVSLQALKFYTNAQYVEIYETFPAAYFLFADPPEIPVQLYNSMDKLSPGGVKLHQVNIGYEGNAHTFRFSKDVSPEALFVLSDGSALELFDGDLLGIHEAPQVVIDANTGFAEAVTPILELYDGSALQLYDDSVLAYSVASDIQIGGGHFSEAITKDRVQFEKLELYDGSLLELFDGSTLDLAIGIQ